MYSVSHKGHFSMMLPVGFAPCLANSTYYCIFPDGPWCGRDRMVSCGAGMGRLPEWVLHLEARYIRYRPVIICVQAEKGYGEYVLCKSKNKT